MAQTHSVIAATRRLQQQLCVSFTSPPLELQPPSMAHPVATATKVLGHFCKVAGRVDKGRGSCDDDTNGIWKDFVLYIYAAAIHTPPWQAQPS